MNKVKQFFVNNWPALLSVLALLVVVYLIYYAGKKTGTGNTTVVDDQGNIVAPTAAQTAQAENIATRIRTDLNSGTFFGYNVWGNVGRDTAAYAEFANMSDSLFAFTAQTYRTKYGTSIIADIRDESSLPTGGIGASTSPKDLILQKADRLQIQ